MRDFAQASDLCQGFLGLLALAGLLMLLYDLLRGIQLGRKRMCLLISAMILLSFCHLQVMIMNAYFSPFFPLGIHLKLIPTATVCLGLIILSAFLSGRIRYWSRNHISAMSVKEAFDRLPSGLCYSLPGGLTKLVNARMNALCIETLGEPLMNPEDFWSALEKGELRSSLQGGETPMLAFPDGRVYSFRRRVLDTELGPVHEIMAMDVSRDWTLNRELEQKQARAREVNNRLRALLSSIEYLTMSRELIHLKSDLHDRLGESLLLSRRFLLEPDNVEASAVREAWLKNLNALESSQPESWQKPYFIQEKHAESVGLRLELNGSLPQETRLIPVVETALSVHTTNVLRHARGSRAMVACTREEGGWRLILTNDGAPPAGQVREGGGLGNLRSMVESLGGRMEIESLPTYRLQLWLPGEEGEGETK